MFRCCGVSFGFVFVLMVAAPAFAWNEIHQTDASCKSNQGIAGVKSSPIIIYGHTLYRNFYKQFSCDDLFSVNPIASVASLRSAKQSEWFPFCSYYHMTRASVIRGEMTTSPGDIKNEAARALINRDFCFVPSKNNTTPPSQLPSKDRSIKPSTNKTNGPRVASDAQKYQHLKKIRAIRDRITQLCCADGLTGCADAMKNIKFDWCNPTDNVQDKKSCSRMTTYFQLSDEQWKNIYDFYLSKKGKSGIFRSLFGNFQEKPFFPSSGQITFSPYVNGNQFSDNDYDIFHELGHACSYNRRQLEIRNGSGASLNSLVNVLYRFDAQHRPSTGCAVSGPDSKVYEGLFTASGANLKTFNCVREISLAAPQRRFENGKCPFGCSTKFLEESFADWVALNSLSSSEILEFGLHNFCIGTRDDEHPLGADSFKCFLQTPGLLQKLQKATGCKQNIFH